jgi:hypothetical protein
VPTVLSAPKRTDYATKQRADDETKYAHYWNKYGLRQFTVSTATGTVKANAEDSRTNEGHGKAPQE